MLLLFFVTFTCALNFQTVKFHNIHDANDVIEKYSTQPLDHFDLTNKNTINIRYFLNTTYYNSSLSKSPLFVELGGEGEQRASSLQGRFVINTYASKFHGLMLSLEHRFYGKSIPKGGLTQDNLGYLNTPQALEDYIHIINDIKTEFNVTGPVIVFGGSYPGNLATWIRQKYPNIVYAAVASSAPVKATNQFVEFLHVIATSFSEECSTAWSAAMDAIEEQYKTEDGKHVLEKDFATCTPLGNDWDFTIFMQQLQATMVYYPQYNGSYSLSVEQVCEMLTKTEKTPYENMKEFYEYARKEFSMECSPSNYEKTITAMKNTKTLEEGNAYADTRSWSWQICTEYSYFQPVTADLPFSKRLTNEFYYKLCQDMFGMNEQRVDRRWKHTNLMFGEFEPKTTNVAFTSGSTDPWNPLCKHTLKKSDLDCYASHIQGTAHCADLYAEKESDPEQLIKQRKETFEFIEELINRF